MVVLLAVAMAAPTVLQVDLGRQLDDSALLPSSLSVAVWDESGAPVFERDPHRQLVPASVLKVLSTAAAVDVLGLDHQVVTQVVATAPVEDGVLRGDLVIVGAGDPRLGGEDPVAMLRSWALQLRREGVTAIAGDVVGDGRVFDDHPLGRGWSWDDALWSFSAPVTGLQIGQNRVSVTVHGGGSLGDPLTVEMGAFSSCLAVDVEGRTGDGEPLWVDRGLAQSRVRIGGGLPVGGERALRLTMVDPQTCAATLFVDALRDAGVRVDGVSRAARGSESFAAHRVWVEEPSPTLGALLTPILQDSDNLVAESVARWLDPAPVGKSFDGALPAIQRVVAEAGGASDLTLADGSGLSRYNQLDAASLASVLMWASRQRWGPQWRGHLAVAGQSGTLRSRMQGGPAAGTVSGKTGSMTGVHSLAAYVPSERGDLIYVILSNGVVVPRAEIRELQDGLAQRLAQSSDADDRRCGGRCQRRRAR